VSSFFFIKTIFINTVQRYYLQAKYTNLVFALFQEKHRAEFVFRLIEFVELFELLNRLDL